MLEKTAVGFYLSGHLFDEVEAEVRRFVRTPLSELRDSREPQVLAGIVSDLRVINGQRGKLCLFKIDDKSTVIEASVDEALLNAHRDTLKDDEFVVFSAKLQVDRFSGGLRAKVQHLWGLADSRCRFGRYLQVSTTDKMPDVPRMLREFPAKREASEHGDVLHGLKVRLGVRCESELGAALVELQLGDNSRFFPSDAALAAWCAEAGSGRSQVMYE